MIRARALTGSRALASPRVALAGVIVLAALAGAGIGRATVPSNTVDLGATHRAAEFRAPAHVSGEWRNLRRTRLPGPYPAQVLEVIDGDTFAARIAVWPGQEIVTLVRLRGVDAPEAKGRCSEEIQFAQEAKQALTEYLATGRVSLRDVGTGKYAGRVIARVHVTARGDQTATEAGAMLLAGGYARPYRGGRRNGWCPGKVAVWR
ncbi:MAG: thermonuclease family protein [Beijerinckiaceae bacterium]